MARAILLEKGSSPYLKIISDNNYTAYVLII